MKSIGYAGMHRRLRRSRGSASDHLCVDCSGSAEDWSYVGGCEFELTEDQMTYRVHFCLHLDHYFPRCTKCHAKYDAPRRNALRGEASPSSKLTGSDVVQMRLSYAEGGITQQDLADRYGVSIGQVNGILHGSKWSHIKVVEVVSKYRGDDHFNAKLNAEKASAIRTKYGTGAYTYRALADEYGVNITTIRAVVKGRTWR